MKTILYVGLRKGLDAYMYEHDINPAEHGKSIKWANNGPDHMVLSDAPIEVVQDDDWYQPTLWDELAIARAKLLNDAASALSKAPPRT